VLAHTPTALHRADCELLASCWIEALEWEDLETLCERHSLDSVEIESDEEYIAALRKHIGRLTETQLIRFLFELALLPHGYSARELGPDNTLTIAAGRYRQEPATRKSKNSSQKSRSQESIAKNKTRVTVHPIKSPKEEPTVKPNKDAKARVSTFRTR
jgi:hypothetical protein